MFLLSTDYLNKTAIIDNKNYISYNELIELVDDLGKKLEPRTLIFILTSNNLDSIVTYLACLNFKIVPLLLNENINKNHLDQLLDIYAPKYIFCKNNINNQSYSKHINLIENKIYINKKYFDFPLHKDLSLLLTTSGSTGSPKLVKLTKKNIISNAKSISKFLNLGTLDRSITSLPFYYSYGLSVVNSHLYSGGSIVLSKSSMVENSFWKNIKYHKVTNIAGVPYNYEILLKLNFNKLKLPSLNKMTLAGGKLNTDKIKIVTHILKSKNIDFFVMYGQTEATARISFVPSERLSEKINSIGIAIPHGKLWIEDTEGKKINQIKTIGELVYKGPNVSMGYAENRDNLLENDQNLGVLKTGDMAYFDEDGYYFIEGKNNRYIKVFGNRLSLDSLEDLISKEGYENLVTGKEDKINIFLKKQHNMSIIVFKKRISELIGINPIAIQIKIVDEFPRLESGKIDYKVLQI